MQLPIDVTFPGRAPNRLVGTYTAAGTTYPAETYVRFEPLNIDSDPARCTDPAAAGSARPWFLEFCTDPTPCAGIMNAPLECLSEPERFYVIPFRKSFRWNAADAQEHGIGNVNVDVEICGGCGRRFFD